MRNTPCVLYYYTVHAHISIIYCINKLQAWRCMDEDLCIYVIYIYILYACTKIVCVVRNWKVCNTKWFLVLFKTLGLILYICINLITQVSAPQWLRWHSYDRCLYIQTSELRCFPVKLIYADWCSHSAAPENISQFMKKMHYYLLIYLPIIKCWKFGKLTVYWNLGQSNFTLHRDNVNRGFWKKS